MVAALSFHPQKTRSRFTARDDGAQRALHVGRQARAVVVSGLHEQGLELRGDDPVEHRDGPRPSAWLYQKRPPGQERMRRRQAEMKRFGVELLKTRGKK